MAKMLATRLNEVIEYLVSQYQSTGDLGREILDCVLVVNEVSDNKLESKSTGFVFNWIS